MKSKAFYNMCKEGKSLLIEMGEDIHEFTEESFDPGMIGRVIDVSIESKDSYRLLVDMNGHEKHNKSVAQYCWRDDEGELTLCWLDTKWYPIDGIESLYISSKGATPFKVIDDDSLFSKYLQSDKGLGYVEWLECQVKELEVENEGLNNQVLWLEVNQDA